jgi:hypothetical protein
MDMIMVMGIMTAGNQEMRETHLLKNGLRVNALIHRLMTGTMNNDGTKIRYKGFKVILDGILVESDGGAVNQLAETTF